MSVSAAPTLIVHYVEAHEVPPPPEFIEAVLRDPPPGWNAKEVAMEFRSTLFTKRACYPPGMINAYPGGTC